MSVGTAQVSFNEDAVGGAFGIGLDYFDLSANEKEEFAANQSTLEEDEWKAISDEMVRVYQSELVGIQDLQNAGLTRSVALADKIVEYTKINEFTEAAVDMDAETAGDEDRTQYEYGGVPVPITHKEFSFSSRDLKSSRRMGNDLEMAGVNAATRVVTEKLEQILFSGWSPTITDARGNTYVLDGYTSTPNRITLGGSDWGTPGNIRTDVVAMIDALDDNQRTGGGFWLYLNPTQWQELRAAIDPDGDGNLSLRERLNDDFEAEIGVIRRAEYLSAGEAVMVDPTRDVVELVVAENVQPVQWQSPSGRTHHFQCFAAMAPNIKSDSEGNSGVVHTSGI